MTLKEQFRQWWATRKKNQKGITFVNLINTAVAYVVSWLSWLTMVVWLVVVIVTTERITNIIALPFIFICYMGGPLMFSLTYAEKNDNWATSTRRHGLYAGEFAALSLGILVFGG